MQEYYLSKMQLFIFEKMAMGRKTPSSLGETSAFINL